MTRPRTSWARWLVELYLDLRNGYRSARRQRGMVEDAQEKERDLLARRPRIVHAGGISRGANGAFTVEAGWQFELEPDWMQPGLWSFHDMQGAWRYFGYTQKELEEIYARRVEFNIDA